MRLPVPNASKRAREKAKPDANPPGSPKDTGQRRESLTIQAGKDEPPQLSPEKLAKLEAMLKRQVEPNPGASQPTNRGQTQAGPQGAAQSGGPPSATPRMRIPEPRRHLVRSGFDREPGVPPPDAGKPATPGHPPLPLLQAHRTRTTRAMTSHGPRSRTPHTPRTRARATVTHRRRNKVATPATTTRRPGSPNPANANPRPGSRQSSRVAIDPSGRSG